MPDDAKTKPPSLSKLMRLVWIDSRVEQGSVNRSDIATAFGMSIPQASYDMKAYQTGHPDRIEYDHQAKTYRRKNRSKPAYPDHLRLQVQMIVHALSIYLETNT